MNGLLSLSSLMTAIIVFVASVASGLTGFGFGLISVPLLTIFLPPATTVPLILFLTSLSSLVVVVRAKEQLDPRGFLPLLIAGIIGAPLGTYLLVLLKAETLTLLIGLTSVLSSLGLMLGSDKRVREEGLGLACIGVLSGMLAGSTAMSGPPVVLFLANQGIEKQALRANVAFYFVILTVATVPWQMATSLITQDLAVKVGMLMPVLIFGTLLGDMVSRRVGEAMFRKIVLTVVMLAGVVSIAWAFGVI